MRGRVQGVNGKRRSSKGEGGRKKKRQNHGDEQTQRIDLPNFATKYNHLIFWVAHLSENGEHPSNHTVDPILDEKKNSKFKN